MVTDEERDTDRLEIMLEPVEALQRRTGGLSQRDLETDKDECDLTAFRLSVIGENANKLSPSLQERHPHVPWRDMYAFRNIVSHAYVSVEARYVWRALADLPAIKGMCEQELGRQPSPS